MQFSSNFCEWNWCLFWNYNCTYSIVQTWPHIVHYQRWHHVLALSKTKGIFCVHIVCVCDHVYIECGEIFQGFTQRDIAVRWCSSYIHLTYKNTFSKHIQNAVHNPAVNDIKGLTLKISIPSCLATADNSPLLPALDHLKIIHQMKLSLI